MTRIEIGEAVWDQLDIMNNTDRKIKFKFVDPGVKSCEMKFVPERGSLAKVFTCTRIAYCAEHTHTHTHTNANIKLRSAQPFHILSNTLSLKHVMIPAFLSFSSLSVFFIRVSCCLLFPSFPSLSFFFLLLSLSLPSSLLVSLPSALLSLSLF